MSTQIQTLLKHLPGEMFDLEPEQALALRVRNANGLLWKVEGGKLLLKSPETFLDFDGSAEWDGSSSFGAFELSYDLATLTLAELANALQTDGHEVVYENPDLGHISALALLAGEGDQERSNGDHLYVHTSTLWSVMGAYASEIDDLTIAVMEALRQMVMPNAEGEILELWLRLYGVQIVPGETRSQQIERFYREVLRPKNTAMAIERAVLEETGEEIRVEEPWRRMFVVNESVLSGDHRMQDGQFYTYHVIQIVCDERTDASVVMPTVLKNVAGGVEAAAPMSSFMGRYVEAMREGVEILGGRLDSSGTTLMVSSTQVLGVMRLSETEAELVNYLVTQAWNRSLIQKPELSYDRELWGGASAPPVGHADAGHIGMRLRSPIGAPRNIPMAAVSLSDGVPIGDINFVLSRGLETYDNREAMRLSGVEGLSYGETVYRRELVDEIRQQTLSRFGFAGEEISAEWAMTSETATESE